MSSRRETAGGTQSSSNAPRQNVYFVPRDGIDREVITADICRYLGNDALVRPGTYQVRDVSAAGREAFTIIVDQHADDKPLSRTQAMASSCRATTSPLIGI